MAPDPTIAKKDSKRPKRRVVATKVPTQAPPEAPPTVFQTIRIVPVEKPEDDKTQPLSGRMSREERAYLERLPDVERAALLQQLDSHRPTVVPLRFRVARSALPNKAELMQKLSNGCDNAKFENYVESALRLPIGKYDAPQSAEDVPTYLRNARAIMDAEIYGQSALKDQTVRALCSWATNALAGSVVLGLEGPPGVGKTSYAKALGKIMGRPLCCVDLGGLNDVSVLTGHSYSYESSKYGQLAQCLMDCGSSSPIIVFDEVDKLGDSPRAREIEALLIHLTDPSTSASIHDRYFQNIPLDFSRACLVFTMNNSRRVSPILLDRLTMVQMETPSRSDKTEIARRFLIPRELKRLHSDLEFDDEAVRQLVHEHSGHEAGVRNLARAIRSVVETLNVARRGAGETLSTVTLSSDQTGSTVSATLVNKVLPERSDDDTAPTMMYC